MTTPELPEGSSPLTRGKLQHRRVGHDGRGLIPAHAGKTVPDWEHKALPGAHPRSRGENDPWSPTRAPCLGSSPLTRGKLEIDSTVARRGRLIPAHAGKTVASSVVTICAAAHPRSRGENTL